MRAELLGLCYRQAKRAPRTLSGLRGNAGLVHRLRGRTSNRHVQPHRKEQELELYRQKYAGYGPTAAAEWLERDDGLVVPVSTLRVWLSADGLWQQQRRRNTRFYSLTRYLADPGSVLVRLPRLLVGCARGIFAWV